MRMIHEEAPRSGALPANNSGATRRAVFERCHKTAITIAPPMPSPTKEMAMAPKIAPVV